VVDLRSSWREARKGGGSGVVTVESSDGKREREEEGKT
jgi:hypothetical protein